MTRERVGLALLALLVGLVLAGGATAGSAKQATPWAMLSHGGTAARYLSSIGVNPKGVVVQRGRKNYAGPRCPGKGWTCTKSHRVLQFSTANTSVNTVVCSATGGGGSVSSNAGSTTASCTIVQVSTGGNNNATCTENWSTTITASLTQNCSIKQTSGSGANTATVNQTATQGPSSCSAPGTTSLQSNTGAQNATVTQWSTSGAGTANVSQTLSQCAGTTSSSSVNESQTTNQTFIISQGPLNFDPTNANCTNHGQLVATATQSQHQHAVAASAGSGSQGQTADLTGHVDQCSLDLAHYSASQSEDQAMAPNGNVAQTFIGPTKLTGSPSRLKAKRALLRSVCCSFQGVNGGDYCTITQTTSQNGNPAPQSSQTEDVQSSAGTTGSCTSNINTNQNGSEHASTQTGSVVSQSLTCQQQTCTGAQAPTTLVWSGPTQGTYHDPVQLQATLTSAGSPVPDKTVSLTAGAESCQGTTDSNGVASCSVTLGDTPGAVSASASFATTPDYLGSSVGPLGFTVLKAPTALSYTGDTTGDYHDQVTLSGHLQEADNPTTPIAGRTVTFAISPDPNNTQFCSAVTSASGDASCPVTLTADAGGAYTVSANFDGSSDADYLSSPTVSQTFTINPAPTTLTYTGDLSGDYHDPATLKAQLVETHHPTVGVQGATVSLSAGTQACSGTTDASGTFLCQPTLNQAPATYPISAGFAGSTDYVASSDNSQSFTVNQAPTTLTYSGDSSQEWSHSTTLKAKLVEAHNPGTSIAGETITFTLGSQSCSGTTDGTGTASCSFVVSLAPGAYTVTASFAGDVYYVGSSDAEPYTVKPVPTAITYSGATNGDYSDQVTLRGTLIADPPGGAPLSGQTLTFTLGNQSCTGKTNASGVASCTLTINQPVGAATSVVTSYAGTTYYQASSTTRAFQITQEEDGLSYTGPTSAKKGSTITLSAKLTHGTTGLGGRTITFTLGTQSCTGITASSGSSLGVATCTLTLSQAAGTNYTVKAAFAGDTFYEPVSCSKAFKITS